MNRGQIVLESDEKSRIFGETDNYWSLYDEVTDKYDADSMGRLNTELDNLLIFVSHAVFQVYQSF